MHAVVFGELKKYAEARLGSTGWSTVLHAAGLSPRRLLLQDDHPDEEALAIVDSLARASSVPRELVLEDFGEFIAPHLLALYPSLVRPEWRTLDLIEHAEAVIHSVVRVRQPGARPPVLGARRLGRDALSLSYSSQRKMCGLLKGIVKGIARHYQESVELDETACMCHGDPACELSVWVVGEPEELVGPYRLVRTLGEGAMGTVFEARDTRSPRVVALKVLHPELAQDPAVVERFEREARAPAEIAHPNVVQVLESGRDPATGALYLAMHLVQGRDLAGLLAREGPWAPWRAVAIATQVLAALEAAHAAGVVHRDVKPQNVMVSTEGSSERVTLLDFGLARVRATGPLTAAGTILGTPTYMAPEQARGEEVDGRADLWAVGVLLWEMLAGEPPHRASTLSQVHAAARTPPPLPARLEVEPGLAAIVSRALARDPAERFADAAAFRRALEGVAGTAILPPTVPPDLVGQTIDGRYLVQARIGSGGMGSVYRAEHRLLGKQVALKVMLAPFAADPDIRERFVREARAAMEVVHPNAVAVRDLGVTKDGLVYMTQDLVPGRSLRALLVQEKKLRLPRALEIVRQCLRGLGAAHERGIVHRDLKPENVLIELRTGGAEVARVCDFGVAKLLDVESDSLTGQAAVGTPHYMAPEQALGRPVDGRTDLYAMGVVLYELVTGARPFEGGTPGVIMKHVHEQPEPPSKRDPELPRALDVVMRRLLAKDPDRRPATAKEMIAELDALERRLVRAEKKRGSTLPSA